MFNQKYKNEARVKWKLKEKDPAGFACQETRWKLYEEMKKNGEVAKVAVAVPALACKGLLDVPNEEFYDEPCHAALPCLQRHHDSRPQFLQFQKLGRSLPARRRPSHCSRPERC